MSTRIVLGVPTKDDVNLLLKEIGTPPEGTLIPWAKIESVLNMKRGEHRFHTVTKTWRVRLEKEHDILLIAEPGAGLKVSDPSERHDLSHGYYKQSMRRVSRCAVIAENLDSSRLTADQRKGNDFYRRVAGVLKLAANTEAKKLPVSK